MVRGRNGAKGISEVKLPQGGYSWTTNSVGGWEDGWMGGWVDEHHKASYSRLIEEGYSDRLREQRNTQH